MDRLRAMELLIAAVDDGSFSAAGRRFSLSPTSVSRHISDLEEALGVGLVHRSTRHLSLTEAGEDYVRNARAILASLQETEARARAMQSKPSGTLRVHARHMFGLGILAPALPEFRALYPDIEVELHLGDRPANLRETGMDIDFRIAPPQETGLIRRKLFGSDRYLVASPDYVRSMPRLEIPADLANHRCLTYWLGPDEIYWRFLRETEIEEQIINSTLCTNNGQVLLMLARMGHGIALLDDYTVAPDLTGGTLVRLMPDYRVTNTTYEEGIYATFLENVQTPVKIRVFLDFICERLPGRNARKATAS
ncbi:MAG: LysR family transcriptional regulator [Rhodobacter sp.]|nr:LysR family transcriptional regulator [Paracoccaceae bacterium]MCC0076583.1 LysR family transcriptional regulator [Rhodobacter sp.]